MNIAFAKLGKSIKFKGAFSPHGGDNESLAMLVALANNNPNDTFYIAGKSDYAKLRPSEIEFIFPHCNVINVYDHIPFKTMQTRKCYEDPYIQCLNNYFADKNIDAIVMLVGQVGGVSVPGKTWQIRDPTLIASCIDMTANYTSPLTAWLNENRLSDNDNIPIIEIINDPRYTLSQPRDIVFTPDVSLSQYNYSYTNNTIENYEAQLPTIPNTVNVTYNGMEKAFLVGRKFPENLHNERERKFTIVLNEGKPSRYNELKKWVLDNDELQDGLSIYGKWDEKYTEGDFRFKGSLHIDEVQNVMSNTRYTFIIPIKDGWVTSKYIEMIYAGVIPFFHPSYDIQENIVLDAEYKLGDIPFSRLLRPETPEDMMKTINSLERVPESRKFVINALQQMLITDKDLNGENISHEIMSNIYGLNINNN